VLGQSQRASGRHVKILCDAGLGRAPQGGQAGCFDCALRGRRKSSPVLALADKLAKLEFRIIGRVADAARLAAVRADGLLGRGAVRGQMPAMGLRFRSLHIAESEVEAADGRTILGEAPIGQLIDIGTGTGRMLELFCRPRWSCARASIAARKCCGWRAPNC